MGKNHASALYMDPKEWSDEIEGKFEFHQNLKDVLLTTNRIYTIHKNFIITQSIINPLYYFKLFQSTPQVITFPPFINIWIRGIVVKRNIETYDCSEQFKELENEQRIFADSINELPYLLKELELMVQNIVL